MFELMQIARTVVLLLLALLLPAPSSADLGDCGQPSTNNPTPIASDALGVLQASVTIIPCDLCVCDVDRSGGIFATDALTVLRFAVQTPGVTLNCVPCAFCGDGELNEGEECDDGASNSDTSPDACRTDCTQASCGDGVLDSPEDCEPPGQGNCNPLCLSCETAVEICNGVDDDCDTQTDEDLGSSTCGVGPCENTAANCVDGSPNVCAPLPPQPEVCDNGIDEDCDGADCKTLTITMDEPADLVTGDNSLLVTGTALAPINSVTINGVPAALNAEAFSATITLESGPNMVVAVGTDGLGNQGVDSYDITLDEFPPNIMIDSPPSGFVTSASTITVTGVVNDIVGGGVKPLVRVNGEQASVSQGSFVQTGVALALGTNSIQATAEDAVGNQRTVQIQVERATPTGIRVAIESGDGQVGMIGETLAQELTVKVTDPLGNALAGRAVTFNVTRNNGTLSAGETANVRRITRSTNAMGLASVSLTLGDRSGQGNNRVTATALGAAGQAIFCASGLARVPDKILSVMGENQTGLVGSPLPEPFEVLVVDDMGNPIPGVSVLFGVLDGGGSFNGQTVIERVSDDNGTARAVLTLGPATGTNSNLVEVFFPGIESAKVNFLASAFAAGDPLNTRFAGVVLDNANTPIPGALVTGTAPPGRRGALNLVEAFTDENGQFLLSGVAVGAIQIQVAPATSSRSETFPPLAFETVTVAGRINTLPTGPIRIPVLSNPPVLVGGDEDVTVTMDGVPGMSITVFKNSTEFPGGAPTGLLSLNQVHLDKLPMPPPSGTIFMPPAWTIQPHGVDFDPPARVTIPNDGLPPGRVIDIFQFDHAINRFVNIGPGTVSDDGLVIVSDPGFGVLSSGWGGCGQPQPPTTCASSCDDSNPCTRDSCEDGACVHEPEADDTPCGTQTRCSGRFCRGGTCTTLGPEDVCDDDDPCTTDTCPMGDCVNEPIETGGMCDDGNSCTRDECIDGECMAVETFINGTPCDDGDECTVEDQCQMGECIGEDVYVDLALAFVDGKPSEDTIRQCTQSFSLDVLDTNCPELRYEWDFGDGFRAATQSAPHAYSRGGTYTATGTAICVPCEEERDSDSVQVTVGPEIDVKTVTPSPRVDVGKDTVVSYDLKAPGSPFDSVEFTVRNKNDVVVHRRMGLPTASGSYMETWSATKWTQAFPGAFANPNESAYKLRIEGMKDGCTDRDDGTVSTHLVIKATLEDKIPPGATPERSAGLSDVGSALKVVLKSATSEVVVSGASISVTGAMPGTKMITVTDPALDSLASDTYDVILRDFRDEIGNFADDDNDLMNGADLKVGQLDLR